MPLSGVAVTPDFIAQHVAARIQGESIGLAIVRIKAGEIPRDLPHGVTVSNGEIHVESANEPRRYSLEDWLSGVQT